MKLIEIVIPRVYSRMFRLAMSYIMLRHVMLCNALHDVRVWLLQSDPSSGLPSETVTDMLFCEFDGTP
jgi:hypothetical protein